ncbi:peroxiredoxin [Sulfodiicoccus acidiphilus]|uniref:peroxiredoxin n=1 Tax=Sulfodiicoccus acidiphilus TaxID=1670455 RepID=UPI000F82248A|nr:peroxiredoxin [Sulfodiicoccus acidiphilus]
MALKVGTRAPDFEGVTDSGEKFRLSDLIGKKHIVLYFYPKDDTPGCTAEACSFRDNWEEVKKYDAVVIGVSSDSVESHRQFKSKYSLPFTLISDTTKEIRKLYDVKGTLMPPRVTFVIDKDGIIRHVYDSQLNATAHVREAVNALKKIAPPA